MKINELNACRHRLNSLQRHSRPSKSPSTPKTKSWQSTSSFTKTRNEIQRLRNETIPQLEKEIELLAKYVDDQLLPMVHNQVDEVSFASNRLPQQKQEEEEEQMTNMKNSEKHASTSVDGSRTKEEKKSEKEVMDPLFCIGGYEKLPPFQDVSKSNDDDIGNLSILTGVGSILAQILQMYAMDFLNKSDCKKPYNDGNDSKVSVLNPDSDVLSDERRKRQFHLAHVPDPSLLKLNVSTAHSVLGCSNIYCPPNVNNSSDDESTQYTTDTDDTYMQYLRDRYPVLSKNKSNNEKGLNEYATKLDPKLCHICYKQAIYEHYYTSDSNADMTSLPKIDAPNYILLSLLHLNKNYSESMLPMRYCASIPTSEETMMLMPTIRNPSNTQKKTPKVKSKSVSPRYAHTIHQWHLLALCANDLQSSRQIQYDFVHQILDFYESLICIDTDEDNNCDIINIENDTSHGHKSSSSFYWERRHPIPCVQNHESPPPLLRAYSIFKSTLKQDVKLEPNEASRIIIEGYLPSSKEYITLGIVSNFTDFISRSFKTKCGGGSGGIGGARASHLKLRGGNRVLQHRTNGYVHSVYGTFCKIDESLTWMLENNIVRVVKNQESFQNDLNKNNLGDGIVVPADLVIPYPHLWGEEYMGKWYRHMIGSSSSTSVPNTGHNNSNQKSIGFVIPFTRKKYQTKHGKSISRAVTNASLTFDHLQFGRMNDLRIGSSNDDVDDNDTNIDNNALLEYNYSTSMKETSDEHKERKSKRASVDGSKKSIKSFTDDVSDLDILSESQSDPYGFLPFYE